MMKKLSIFCFFTLLIFSVPLSAQIYIAVGDSVSENFDGLGTSATASMPANWKIDKHTNTLTLGSYSAAGQDCEFRGGNSMGNLSSNGIYNFGAGPATSATDRAPGFLAATNNSRSGNVYALFNNNGTDSIHLMDVRYNVEKYRNGSNNKGFAIQLHYSYNGSTWISAGLDFRTIFPDDGNNSGYNPAPGTTVAVSGKLYVDIPPGGNFYLCWNYSVASNGGSNNAQALAIDDVRIDNMETRLITAAWHYQSTGNGHWKNKNNWEISETGLGAWVPAYSMPTDAAFTITVRNGHTIEVDTSATATDVTIENGAILNNPGNRLEIKGDLKVHGTMSGSSGDKLVFRGNGNQKISGSGSLVLSTLTINKGSGIVTLERPVTVDILLELRGVLNSSSSNILTLAANSGLILDNSTLSYIEGPVRKIGDSDFTFPVGKNGTVKHIAISDLSAISGFTAEYFDQDPDISYSALSKDSTIGAINACDYWMLDRTSGSASARVTLYFDDACGAIDPSYLLVSKWDGSKWTDQGNGAFSGDSTSGTITSLNLISQFSPYSVGVSSSLSAMPIKLLYFSGIEDGKKVELSWQTATETNNKHFILEKSSDGLSFKLLGKVNGAGNSSYEKSYSFTDNAPYQNYTYYRLSQVDFNGKTESFDIIAVKISPDYQLRGKAYSNSEGITIKFNSVEPANIRIMGFSGEKAFSMDLPGSGEEQSIIVPSSNFNPGLYFVQVNNGVGLFIEKVLVSKQ